MTVQMPPKPRAANPFLNSLNTPAFQPSRRVVSMDELRSFPSMTLDMARRRSHQKPKTKKSPAATLLGWVFVIALLALPMLSTWLHPKQPVQVSIIPTLPVLNATISSPFGPRWGRMHQGIDFAAQAGSPIYATASGKVIHSGWEAGYGKSVVIQHDSGMQTRYAHCARLLVKEGKQVSKGDVIAKVGSTGHSTGPHLHFEVIVNGERRNPAWYYALRPATVNQQLASH